MPMAMGRAVTWMLSAALACGATALHAQTPQPFPKPTGSKPASPETPVQPPAAPAQPPPAGGRPAGNPLPTEEGLGVAIYPNAIYLTSYDAGRGQRFYIFGTAASFADLVNYYRTILKQRGAELFTSPPTHQFETGRFREETMAFPPSVTIKDYTFGGSAGYANPNRTGTPRHFPTIIQIVPSPPGTVQ
jgi:hypothetical protein